MKIVYVVSCLKNTGPTNQLANIANNIAAENITILTLKGSNFNTENHKFNKYIKVRSLNLSIFDRFISVLKIKSILKQEKADVIHTQGFFSDFLLSRLPQYNNNWISTIRNYPFEDYPFKYNYFLGFIMSYMHLNSLRKCKNLVACSKYIKDRLNTNAVNSVYINNVSSKLDYGPIIKKDIDFLILGSLINRKNNKFILKHINNYSKYYKDKTFYFVGSGNEYDYLLSMIPNEMKDNVVFTGQVADSYEYIKRSRFLISASSSEGLPNNVLEALNFNVPCILSNIEPHSYFTRYTKNVYIFNDDIQLHEYINNSSTLISQTSNDYFENFSLDNLSSHYLKVYTGVMNENLQ